MQSKLPRCVLAVASISIFLACQSGKVTGGTAVETKTLSVSDGTTISYLSGGHGSPQLVFVHGWACDRSYWKDQIDHFRYDNRLLAIDLAGHGESGSSRSDWSIDALAQDLAEVLVHESLNDVILIGHSLGAAVVVLTAQKAANRVTGVVIVDAMHDLETPHREQSLSFIAALESDFAGTLRSGIPNQFGPYADQELIERIALDMASAPPGLSIELERSYADMDFKAAIELVAAPMRAINAYATNIAANRQYSQDYEAWRMEDVGHFLMLERPREFNELLNRVISEIRSVAD